jgi:hypothetical protein
VGWQHGGTTTLSESRKRNPYKKIKHFPAAACFFMKHAAAVFIVYDSLGTLEPQTCIGLFGTANNIIYKKGNICYTIAI